MKKRLLRLSISCAVFACFSALSWGGLADSDNGAKKEKLIQSIKSGGLVYGSSSSSVAASAKFSNEYRQLLFGNSSKMIHDKEGTSKHQDRPLSKNINYYMRGLMQDLMANLQYVNASTPLAVTSFVLLDGDYSETNLLGLQISESLMHEIHKFGIPIIDFKASNDIQVTKEGDFIFSRNRKKLQDDLPIRYVVGGTLVKHQGGYLVNARIIGVESKAVVASAQSFISAEVAGAIMNSVRKKKTITPSVSIIQG